MLQLSGCAPSFSDGATRAGTVPGGDSDAPAPDEVQRSAPGVSTGAGASSPLARYVQALPRWTDELGSLLSIEHFDSPSGAEVLVLSNAQLPLASWILGPGMRWRERVALVWSKGERRLALRMVSEACARAERSWLAMRWRVHALTEGILQPGDILDQPLQDPLQTSLYNASAGNSAAIGDFSDDDDSDDDGTPVVAGAGKVGAQGGDGAA